MSALPKWTPCARGCRGWFVSETDDERGVLIVKCDECRRFEYDDDAAKLPEAIRALAAHLVPRKRQTRAALKRERAAALREHALRCALSAVLAWTTTQSVVDRVHNIERIKCITRAALGLDE